MSSKTKKILLIILNTISIIVFVAITTFTIYVTNSYMRIEHTEGTGLFVALVWVVGSFECLSLLVLNAVSLWVLRRIKDKNEYGKNKICLQKTMSILLMILPIAILVVEVLLMN